MTPWEWLGSGFMMVGTVISVLAAWGIVDFPTPLARMHAATKSPSLGLSMIVLGAALASGSLPMVGVAALVAAFLFVTAPISGHLLGRAVYLAGQAGTLVHDDLASVVPVRRRPQSPEGRRISVIRLVVLTATWSILWQDARVGTIVAGLAVATVVDVTLAGRPADARAVPVGVLRFVGAYLGMVVTSNIRVAWEIITPRNDRIVEAVVGVPLDVDNDAAALLVANAISYAPGTLTIELSLEPRVVYVHVLHFAGVEQVTADVRKLEALAQRALRARAQPATAG